MLTHETQLATYTHSDIVIVHTVAVVMIHFCEHVNSVRVERQIRIVDDTEYV